jgi:hypothetical protein
MIRRPNGTPYVVPGRLGLYSPNNPDHSLMDRIDMEAIKMGGSPILYYRVIIKGAKVDPLYHEIRDKLYAPPVEICSVFSPPTPLQNQDQFGIDSPTDVLFTFNLTNFTTTAGELPTTGSLIFTVVDRNWWEIIQPNINILTDMDRMIWNKLRVQVNARKYQPTATEHDPGRYGYATNVGFPIR